MTRRRSTKLVNLRAHAKRHGWLKWIREGLGEEADERALLNGCWFVPDRGRHVCDWIERYCHLTDPAWRGKPFLLLDWQRDWLMRLFGWVRFSREWDQVVRRFKWSYIEVPKKNGKSPLLAAIGCYLLFGDGDHSARVFSTATSKKQACIVHGAAVKMVRGSPDLSAAARIRKEEGYYAIEYPDRGGHWSIAAANAATADGVNGHCLADELHRWKDWEFWNTIRWMLAAMPEGIFAAITTAGSDMASICRTQHDKTKAINEGRQHDDQFYGRIYGAGKEDDPHKQSTWFKANPGLGKTKKAILKLSDFRADYKAATQDPTQWPDWQRLRLGVWRTAEDAWIDSLGGLARWDAGDKVRRRDKRRRVDCYEPFTIDQLAEKETPSWFALDGATHHDTTSAVFVFPDEKEDEVVRMLPFFWLPEAEAIRLGERVPFRHWSDRGYITLTDGDACDYGRVKADLLGLIRRLNVQAFCFDPLFQAEWLTQQIADETGLVRHEFPQTIMHFSPAMKTLGRLITVKKARHNGHPLFTWQLGHTKAYTDCNGNERPVRQKKGDHRTIDGPVAAVMAMSLALSSEDDRPTYYDDDSAEVEFL